VKASSLVMCAKTNTVVHKEGGISRWGTNPFPFHGRGERRHPFSLTRGSFLNRKGNSMESFVSLKGFRFHLEGGGREL